MKSIFSMMLLVLVCLPEGTAAGKVNYMSVEDNTLLFRLDQAKPHFLPDCVADEQAQLWAIAVDSAEGKATQVLLVTAISSGLPVKVDTTQSCIDGKPIEAANGVSLLPES